METVVHHALLAVVALLWTLLGCGPALVFLWGICYCLTLPLRRQERVRLFLDVLEIGLRQGFTAEQVVVSVAESRGLAGFKRLSLVAKRIRGGASLTESLKTVEGVLPANIVACLTIGQCLGNIRRILPVCRRMACDAVPQTHAAGNYLVALMTAGVLTVVMPLYYIAVVPRLQETLTDVMGHETVLGAGVGSTVIVCLSLGSLVLLLAGCGLFVGGRWLTDTFESERWGARLALAVPWRRKRLMRDFSVLLAELLDAGVPEQGAMTMAAESTGNAVMIQRASLACEALRNGAALPDAVAVLDGSGEFRWRLSHAAHDRQGFLSAMRGWHDALDAKAFQEQQIAAHVITTVMVVANGIVVGVIATGVFGALTAITRGCVLW